MVKNLKRCNKQNFGTKKKKKWNGQAPPKKSKFSHPPSCSSTENEPPDSLCSSAKKLKDNCMADRENTLSDDYFIFVNFGIFKSLFDESGLCCPDCHEVVEFFDNNLKRRGFAHCLSIKCTQCDWIKTCYSSSEVQHKGQPKKGRKMYDINARAVIGFREVGCGYSSMKTLSSFMNTKCLAENAFQNINKQALAAYKTAAESSMKLAAIEAKKIDHVDSIPCLRVSIDGSWQKRGHNSLHGIVSAMSGNKCIDIDIRSKHCFGCRMWQSKKGSPEYLCWKVEHQCDVNHEKSSGAMESAGAVAIFSRSLEKHGIIYKEYLGDGDTSSFNDVLKSAPYKDYTVDPIKLECVGHVQKRLGTRLRNLVKGHKGTDKPISGKGKLTDKCINSMQNYYGLAIRNNTENLYAMKKAVYAILFHFTEFDDINLRHQFCPRDSKSWCKYWALNNKTYQPKSSIPVWIKTLILPIIKALQSDELLSKCLHGETQNCNEALNALIWSKVPKSTFVSKRTIEIGTYSAIINYNDGCQGVMNVLEHFGIRGSATSTGTRAKDAKRVQQMKRKSTVESKKQRKKLRSDKKGYSDKTKENEKQESYISGGF